MLTIQEFVKTIQSYLQNPIIFNQKSDYLDLGQNKNLSKDLLLEKRHLSPDHYPLGEAVYLIIQAMQRCQLTKAKLGINELFKAYLSNINPQNQEECTEVFLDYIYELYLYSLKDSFPFTDLLWGYLSSCFFPVSIFLVDQGYVEGCKIFLSTVSTMGKLAAQRGLHTSNIQEFLHTLELRAQELELEDLGAIAKSHRFNLETF